MGDIVLTDGTPDQRQKYIEFHESMSAQYHLAAIEYQKRAIEFANSTLRALTYLNGGALVAIPTIVALFQADAKQVKFELAKAAVCFIGGLLAVATAQGAAFFTVARRSEAHQLLGFEQTTLMASLRFPENFVNKPDPKDVAATYRQSAESRVNRSNIWRRVGVILSWISLICFIFGCYFGSLAVF